MPPYVTNSVIREINDMIDETLAQTRKFAAPPMGGPRQAPFDGEVLGTFLRYAVLCEVRARLTGEEIDFNANIDYFNAKTGMNMPGHKP